MAVTVVQGKCSAENVGGTGASVTLSSSTTSGNTLVFGCHQYSQTNGTTIPAIPTATSDGGHNTLTRITAAEETETAATYGMRNSFFYATNIVGGATTCSFTTSSAYTYLVVWELSPSRLDQASVNVGTSATSISAGTVTPSANGSVSCAMWSTNNSGSGTWTQDSGWVLTLNGFAGSGATANGSLTQATAASLPLHITCSASSTFCASGVVFIPPTVTSVPSALVTWPQAMFRSAYR
jgi:hypothetical protein